MNDRKHLTPREVERLITATRGSRTELRDRCLILLMFRHGLRVSEACALKLHQVDLESRVLHVARLKKGLSTTHPLRGDELRAIKAWLTERARLGPAGDTFFVSERRAPLNRQTAWGAIRRYGELAGLPLDARCATPAATPWPTRARTPGSSRTTWGTATSSTPCAIRQPTRRGSSGCGGEIDFRWLLKEARDMQPLPAYMPARVTLI